MDWILGISSGLGASGCIVLGILIYLQNREARADAKTITSLTKTVGDLQRDNDGYKSVVETRDETLKAKQNELSKAREALAEATNALVATHQKLAERGDASSVASDLNSVLDRIRNWN